jgi:hypothetical protein
LAAFVGASHVDASLVGDECCMSVSAGIFNDKLVFIEDDGDFLRLELVLSCGKP